MKIGAFITARLKSTRLEQKILLDLDGKSVLDRVIDRCKAINGIDGVVLCTSTNPQDAILEKNASNNNIQFYKGSENDVLDRLLKSADEFKYDAFISITADNPLFSIEIANEIIKWYKKDKPDFIFSNGLPMGCIPYFIKTNALKVAIQMKSECDTEIWGPFVNRPDFFKIGYLSIKGSLYKEEKRLTCDYPEDLELMKTIYKAFPKKEIISTKTALLYLKENPDLWLINSMHVQRQLPIEVLNEINAQFDSQIEKGKLFAQEHKIMLNPGTIKKEYIF